MIVGIISVGVMTVGVLSVGVMTLSQSYNDGMVNPEVVCHPSMASGPTKYFLQKKILFHVDLIKMLPLISLFLRFPSYFPQNSG
jgi:hypothetical protein